MKSVGRWLVVLVLAACGAEDDTPVIEDSQECSFAGGTHTIDYVRKDGDCGTIPVEDRDVELNEAECGSVHLSNSWNCSGCTCSETVTFKVTDDGIEDGKSVVKVDCTAVDNTQCTANFNVYFEKR